ncbi:6712_t:CDS:2, partial [Scutellospora calospora]
MDATMSTDNNYNIRKDAICLKSLMITEEEWNILEELTILLVPFAEITELLGGSNYSILSFMWLAIITLTRKCEPLLTSINEELDLINMLTVFEEEEENIVDLDEELEIIVTANGDKFKINQPQNTEGLVDKDTPIDSSLIAILLDPRYKSMKKLDSWERNKAINVLRDKYNSLSTGNKTVTNLVNVDQNENQINLFSKIFG